MSNSQKRALWRGKLAARKQTLARRVALVAKSRKSVASAQRVLKRLRERVYPKVAVTHIVGAQSARSTGALTLIVLHDTESHNVAGVTDLVGLGNYFDSGAQASSHVATDADGQSARFVRDDRKAWHVAAFNSPSLGIEQIGFASQTSWPDAQLRETARWIAYWSAKHGIPIQRGAVLGSSVTRPGVVLHSDLGVSGGGHHDPGPAYPVEKVLDLARHYKSLQ